MRGQQALKFINKSLEFADFVAFILPPLFDSDGRGSPKKRVNGNLICTEQIDNKYFYPDGTPVSVQTIFQVWTRLDFESLVEKEEKPNGFKVYSISDGGTSSSTRNKDMIGHCDFYLPSTVFGEEKMIMYYDFDSLPQRRGFGVKFDVQNLDKVENINWAEVAFKSTNGAVNLRSSLITKALNQKLSIEK